VYVPLLMLQGVEGKMFRPMALTVLFALGGAFVASLTLVPVLVATLLRKQTAHTEPWLVRQLEHLYAPMLRAALGSPRAVIAAALIGVLGAVWLVKDQGAEFVPRLDEGAVAINITRLPSVTLEESVAGAGRMERALLKFPEVVTVVSKTGRAELSMDPMGVEMSDLLIQLKPRDQWTSARTKEALIELMEARLKEAAPGMNAAFSQPIELRMAELLSGSKADVAITLYGEDLAELERLSTALQATIRKVPGAADVRGEPLTGLPTLEIRPLRAEAARYGVDTQEIFDAVEAIGGRHVGAVYEGQRRFALQVRLQKTLREDVERLKLMPIGQTGVPLAQVASVTLTDSPAVINHEGTRRRTMVEVNVRGRDLSSFVADARRAVRAEITLPAGYVDRWGGQLEQLESAGARLRIMIPMVLGLILVLLYMAFGAWRPVAIIALNIPLAAVGGVLALWLRGLPLSISAAVGFIALCGVAVLNGVVLLSTTLKNHAERSDAPEAALLAAEAGATRRMRAVVMTALVAALGFLPMALSASAGAEVQRPLATVVIGGLFTSTLLTLFVLPSVYALVMRGQTPRADI
jgi:heavy metal efflux system protein